MDTTIAFPLKPAAEEVVDDVRGDRVQSVIAGEQVILPSEFPFQTRLLIDIEVGRFDDGVDVVIEGRILQSKFRRPVVVEQANGGVIFDGLLKVVDGDVVAKDILGALLAGDQRGCP